MMTFIDTLFSELTASFTLLKISSPFDTYSHTVFAIKDYYQHRLSQINIYGVIVASLNIFILLAIVTGIILALRSVWRRILRKRLPPAEPATREPAFGLSVSVPAIGRIITLLIVLSIVFFAASTIFQGGTKIQNVLRILLLNVFLQVGIVVVILSNIPLRTFMPQPLHTTIKRYPYFFILVVNIFILSFVANYGFMQAVHIPPSLQPIIVLLFKQNHPGIISTIGLQAIFLAPVAEELLFRGFLFRLANSYTSFFPAALISSMVFASLHKNLFIFVPLMCLGMTFAYAYKKTRNIFFPILLHAGYNLIMFLYVICIKHMQA